MTRYTPYIDVAGSVLIDSGVVLDHFRTLSKLKGRQSLAKALRRWRYVSNHEGLRVPAERVAEKKGELGVAVCDVSVPAV
jgi:hypothetical protein